jgi:hypothetical protein
MRADQEAFLLEGAKVAAHGCIGDREEASQFGSGYGALGAEDFFYSESPFCRKHLADTALNCSILSR